MKYQIGAELIKAGEAVDNKLPIEIVASHQSIDRQNDMVTLKAFEEAKEGFLDDGIIDYDHQSVLGKSKLEKAQAIIGNPEDLFIDKKRKVPVCQGYLFIGNPYVDNVIMPALNSGSKVFGASVGGKTLLKSESYDPTEKKEYTRITKILLKHIAITPRQNAVNPRTSVSLIKSDNGDQEYLFSHFEDFIKSFNDECDLNKALVAGAETNISGISGGQTLQNQSLEGDEKSRIKYALPFIIDYVTSPLSNLRDTRDYLEYLTKRGFSPKEAMETIKLIAENSSEIIKLVI